jgi:uncharacterized protein (TIGR02266 family)
MIELKLQRWKYKVTTADNGEDALNIVKNDDSIDLVITDIKMPGLYNGIQLLDEIKKCLPFKPIIIFITGFSCISIEDVYDKGAHGYIEKPIDNDYFHRTIEEILKEPPKFQKRYERADVKLEVRLKMRSLDDSITTHTLNIGQGGIFVYSDKFSEIKDIAEFEIVFREGTPKVIAGTGEIVWIRQKQVNDLPIGMGIKFINLPPEQEKFIDSFVKKHKTIAYIPKK